MLNEVINWKLFSDESPPKAKSCIDANRYLVTALNIETQEKFVLSMEYRKITLMGETVSMWWWEGDVCPFYLIAWAEYPKPYEGDK